MPQLAREQQHAGQLPRSANCTTVGLFRHAQDRITGGNAEELAQVSLSNLQQRRAEDAEDQGGTDKRRIMDAMVRG
jgi:hypothetical protein